MEWYRQEGTSPPPAVFPLTPDHVGAVGCILEEAEYRSAYNYLNAAKRRHIKLGYAWTDALELAAREYGLSTRRGLGPTKQAEPLPFERLANQTFGKDPICEGGPVGPGNALTLFTYFLARGIEGRWPKSTT